MELDSLKAANESTEDIYRDSTSTIIGSPTSNNTNDRRIPISSSSSPFIHNQDLHSGTINQGSQGLQSGTINSLGVTISDYREYLLGILMHNLECSLLPNIVEVQKIFNITILLILIINTTFSVGALSLKEQPIIYLLFGKEGDQILPLIQLPIHILHSLLFLPTVRLLLLS